MIRYLAYYSIGGYKDILAGSTSELGDEEGLLYYSSFLQPWLDGKMEFDDEHSLKQLNILKDKPHMEVLSPQSEYKMKSMSKILVAHAGYQLACCSLGYGEYGVAIRDLMGSAKDEFGRPIPFMMQFVCDNPIEADSLANHFRCDIEEVRKLLGGLFSYNPILNCVNFDLRTINSFVQKITSIIPVNQSAPKGNNKPIRQIMLSEGITLSYALKELGMSEVDLNKAYDANGKEINFLNLDNCNYKQVNVSSEDESSMEASFSNKQGCIQLIIEFLAWLKKHATFTSEDRKDISGIMKHIKNILIRRK